MPAVCTALLVWGCCRDRCQRVQDLPLLCAGTGALHQPPAAPRGLSGTGGAPCTSGTVQLRGEKGTESTCFPGLLQGGRWRRALVVTVCW